MLTAELQKTINTAAEDAYTRRHEYLTLEHLLKALLDELTGSDVIVQCGGNLKELKEEVEQFIAENFERVPDTIDYALSQTASYERVVRRALVQAHSSAQTTIDGGNIIAAMFEERRSHAVYLLEKQGITRLDVLNYISHGISKIDAPQKEEEEEMEEAPT
jgi:ATP-dependent Clp protease ATP-binding subunit ClpA